MWRNYLTVGIRALVKNKTYAFINIVGLAIGLAACLMLLVYVRYETSYDRWLPNAENTYQLQTRYTEKGTGQTLNLQMASYVSGQRLKDSFPQIESATYVSAGGTTVIRGGQALSVENASLVNGPFFDTVQIPLLHGDPRSALQNPGSVALSETTARRLFGTDNPVGQTLTQMLRGRQVDFRVTAVFRDLPRNSHMRFAMLSRIDPTSYYAENPTFLTNWGWQSGWYYVRLRPGTDPAAINAALPAWERRVIPTQVIDGISYNPGDESDYRLADLQGIHLGDAQDGNATPGNDWTTINIFLIIAFLILGMACVNFVNLATARAGQRAREVALRKVLGANRKQLITQFLGESVLIACISMLIALAMVEVLLPAFSRFLDADFRMTYFGQGTMLPWVVGLTLLVGAAGGLYPAFYLSRFQPAQVLKANKSSAEASGSGLLRNILVIGQFAVSIGLIICTAVVYAQTSYARTTDPGYRRDGILQVDGIGRRQIVPLQETLIREIERVPGVRSAATTTIGIATQNSTNDGRAAAGPDRADQHRHLPDRLQILRHDGHSPGRRSQLRPQPADGRCHRALPGGPGRPARDHRARRGQRRAQRICGPQARLAQPGRRGRQDGTRRDVRPGLRAGADHDHRRGPGFALPLDPRAARSDHVPHRHPRRQPARGTAGRQRRSAHRHGRRRGGLEAADQRRAVQRPVQRGHHHRAVQGGGRPDEGVRRLRPAGGDHRLPRPVRSRRLHRANGAPRRSASARCSAPGSATSSVCSPGNSPSP